MNDTLDTKNKNIKRKRPTVGDVLMLQAEIEALQAENGRLSRRLADAESSTESLFVENRALKSNMDQLTLRYREALEQISAGVADPKQFAHDALLAARLARR